MCRQQPNWHVSSDALVYAAALVKALSEPVVHNEGVGGHGAGAHIIERIAEHPQASPAHTSEVSVDDEKPIFEFGVNDFDPNESPENILVRAIDHLCHMSNVMHQDFSGESLRPIIKQMLAKPQPDWEKVRK